MLPEQLCLADKGYQGLASLHSSSCLPTKKPRQHRRWISLSVNTIACYHDCESSSNMLTANLKYFGFWLNAIVIAANGLVLRFNLISAILNFELASPS